MGDGLLGLLPKAVRPTGRQARPLQRRDRRQKQRLQPAEMTMTTKAELTRLWTWAGNLIEELSALQDAIAELAEEED